MYFDGDSGDYPAFIKDFMERVGDKPLSDTVKLGQLIECTKGRARDAVKVYRGQRHGYSNATRVLGARFGQPLQIIDALMTRLERQGRLRSNDQDNLLYFADQLEAYYQTFLDFDLMREADTQASLKRVFAKLPTGVQYRWIDKANELEGQGYAPSFRQMVEFVRGQAKRATHPVYQVLHTAEDSAKRPNDNRQNRNRYYGNYQPTVTTMATSMNSDGRRDENGRKYGDNNRSGGTGWKPPEQTCGYCARPYHSILDCPVFVIKSAKERREFARINRLCWCCLGPHRRDMCARRDVQCGANGCIGNHHPLIHVEQWMTSNGYRSNDTDYRRPPYSADRVSNDGNQQGRPQTQQQTAALDSAEDSNSPELPHEESTASLQAATKKVLLRVVPVTLHAAETNRRVTTYALLDTGSTCSMIANEVADALRIKGPKTELNLNTVVTKGQKIGVEIVSVKVGPLGVNEDENWLDVHKAHVVQKLQLSPDLVPKDLDTSQWAHLRDLVIEHERVELHGINVLLGEDVPRAHCILQSVYGSRPDDEPYAVMTPFGWSVAGPTGSIGNCADTHCADVRELELEKAVTKLWDHEKHGFSNEDKSVSHEDKEALQTLNEQTYLDEDGHYVVPLLWRRGVTSMPPNSYYAALRCLESLKRKFQRRPEFGMMYREMINNYLEKGYAARVEPETAAVRTPRTFYLPHQGVTNVNKPGKVRVVFNAAHTVHDVSFNSALRSGPDLNNSMLGILVRFRQGPVALVGDISEMFNQVKVSTHDADAQRFLWYENDEDTGPTTYRMERHIFGATDSPSCCVFALQRTAEDHRDEYDAETVKAVLRNMYVDDLLKACPDVDRAIRLGNQLIDILGKGGFTLTKLMSNRKEVLDAMPAERVAPVCQAVSLDDLPTQRALGVVWNVSTDQLGVKIAVHPSTVTTKRGCLGFIASIPDVMGLLAPVTLIGRRILQETMRRRLEWDEPLPDDLARPWRKWEDSLPALEELSVPRCYAGYENGEEVHSVQLHHFCDSSEYGYGTASYLRIESKDGTVQISFVMGKSRTAPLKFLTIPRLEMQAAVVAARVADFIRRELDLTVDATFYWTDSMITLQYIKTTKKILKTYNANRKQEIMDGSQSYQWHHCPTKENPADIASRGLLGHNLVKSEMWLQGPEFLKKPREEWPGVDVPELADDDGEIKKHVIAALTPPEKQHPTILDLMTRQSSWLKTRKSVAWLKKFIQWLRYKVKPDEPSRQITPTELDRAECDVMRVLQMDQYPDEYHRLARGEQVSRGSPIRNLNPVLIDGVIRVGGRLAEAPLSFMARHPAILPKCHPIVDSIIWSYHHALGHRGPEHTLAGIRDRFWLIGGKSAVKRLTSTCIPCRRRNARRIDQIMSSLPKERVTGYDPPFSVTGMDVFGPLNVKRARSTLKKYVVIFTCFSVRAVHLEVLDNMTTDSFINALVRFTARRGKANKLYCDNGTNFTGGSNELEKILVGARLQNYTLRNGIEFSFQTPTASHTSGVWERLIRSVKDTLKAVLKDALVTEETLSTTLAQVEEIMNSRPITPSSESPDDFSCLTPSHMLLQRASDSSPWCIPDESDAYRKTWRQAQLLAQHYWERWTKVYLPQLQKMTKWQAIGRECSVGDLVLMCDDSLKVRGHWPMGRIVEVFTGNDGHVRSVMVRTSSSTYKRPIQKLSLLEGVI